MATIIENYVSFEIAKLLKEKGFNEPCLKQYYNNGELSNVSIEAKYNTIVNQVSAPTLQMAMKWLREVYNLHIWVEPNHDKEGLYNAHVKVGWWSNNWGGVGYNTYEQAVEEAIKYCLKHLIK